MALSVPVPVSPARATGRLFFFDNIRVFLTVLVVLHHLMVIYAGSGSWIYNEGREDEITAALGGWFCAVNQSYFMGLFLLVSAYFVPGSYARKGPVAFLKDRVIRLGVPLALYGWVLRPALIYAGFSASGELGRPLLDWYVHAYFRDYGIIGGGPLWFIETLLILSAIYVVWRLLARPQPAATDRETPFPARPTIALAALLLGLATFAVRLFFPVDTSFAPLNLQPAHFTAYIAMFVFGLMAYHRNWLVRLPGATGRFWLGVSAALILLFPVAAVLGGQAGTEPFKGGWQWQALLYALWEAFMCLGMSIGLVYLFRAAWDRQGTLTRLLARHAYTTYLIHEPVITLLAVATAGIALYPLLKFGVASLVFVPICFALSILVLKIPGASRVL